MKMKDYFEFANGIAPGLFNKVQKGELDRSSILLIARNAYDLLASSENKNCTKADREYYKKVADQLQKLVKVNSI